MSRAVLLALFMLLGRNLMAQGAVVVPDPPLDSARATLRDALLVLRDSLNSIDAAAARLQRDNRQASPASLLSRARVMRDACARSARALPEAKAAVIRAEASNDVRVKRQGELVQALDLLRDALKRCETEFTNMSQPGQGERVRGYGNDRALRVQTALRRYDRAAGGFLAAMGIKVVPLGSDPRRSAG
jgi:hypothetical protein